jgi:hypothetical protein
MMGIEISISTIENNIRFIKKLKVKLPYDPEIPLLRIYPREINPVC